MQALKAMMWGAAAVAALGAVGCDLVMSGRQRDDRVYVQDQPRYGQPQPVYVQPQPVYVDQQPQYVIVQEAPPPIRIERRPAPPAADVIWIDGYWNWSGRSYDWAGGHYERPPQAGVTWVAPRYDRDARGGVRYTAGQWSKGPGNGQGRGRGN